jgi:hypothetical protein
VDVNIVPLVNNEFTSCKSELKFFEAGIVGTVTCAAPAYIYEKVIEHGKNGYLCRQGEWYTVIKKMYVNGVSPEVAGAARNFSMETYGALKQTGLIETVLNNIIKS